MKRTDTVFSLLAVFASAVPAFAGGGPLPFSFTAPGGTIPAIPEDGDEERGFSIFPLTMAGTIPSIVSLELKLTGLTHNFPDDLDVFLINPFGDPLAIMKDRGDGNNIAGVTLVFNDLTTSVLPDESQIFSGTYLPAGAEGFASYVGTSGGTDSWILLIIDDSSDNTGSLESFTLRGTYVPEPMSLSLLALGGIAAIRRSRR